MSETIITFSNAAGGAYSVELLELLANGTTAKLASGEISSGAINLHDAADILVGNLPQAGRPAAGEALYQALLSALGDSLPRLLDGTESLLFLDIEPNELQKVPWEILTWPKVIAGGVVWARVAAAHHLVRVYRPDWSMESPPPSGPLRLLIVVGTAPENDDIEAAKEIAEIKRNIQLVQSTLDVEITEGYDDLYAAIKRCRPHVLHFIGHGSTVPPLLEFAERKLLPAHAWKASQIATDVGRTALDEWRPGLAFLNACRTGRAAGDLGPLAGAFLEAGARATIAMQGDIRGEAAGCLAGVFYQSIAAGVYIEQALSKARAEVSRQYNDREASYPALTLRCRPDGVFPQFATRIDNYKARALSCPLLPTLRVFVDQVKPRRQLCERLWPFKTGEPRHNFILLHGESGFGKTVLSTWLLDLSANLGHLVRYVNVSRSAGGVDFVNIIELIWGIDTNPPQANRSPLFDALALEPEPLRRLLRTSKDPTLLYAALRQALSDLSKTQPITLVLDEFANKMDEGSFWVLWEHLFVRLAGSDLNNVTVVLVLSEDDYDFYRIEATLDQRWDLRVAKDDVPLAALPTEDFRNLLIEDLYYRSPRFHDSLQRIESIMRDAEFQVPLSIARLEEKAIELARLLWDTSLEKVKL